MIGTTISHFRILDLLGKGGKQSAGWFLGALIATVGLGYLWTVSAQQNPDAHLTTTKVRDHLYVVSGPDDVNTGNVAVFVTDEGVILVDDKFDRHVEAILREVRTVTDQPVRYVLNTHHHLDHSGGNRTFLGLAEIIAHRNARQNMVKRSGGFGSGRPDSDLPRVTFSDVTSIFLGGKEVRAYYFGRGHTDGDIVIHFPAERVIHTGDLYVPGGFLTDYSAGGNALEWDATLRAILRLDFDTIIPGHLQTAVTREDLVQHIQDFKTVRHRVQEIIMQGGSREEIAELLKLEDLVGWSTVPWIPTSPRLKRSFAGLYDELKQAQDP
ncbi:MBL fold metallo-hydrolase [Acidobacteria bacterium AH-259-A15]|nr:MBL fold metallo-hydrolase [Acidobacteria bacterium AH-259-A15]